MTFIKLTSGHDDNPIYIEIGKITAIYTHSDGQPTIMAGVSLIPVRETPDMILAALATSGTRPQIIGLN